MVSVEVEVNGVLTTVVGVELATIGVVVDVVGA